MVALTRDAVFTNTLALTGMRINIESSTLDNTSLHAECAGEKENIRNDFRAIAESITFSLTFPSFCFLISRTNYSDRRVFFICETIFSPGESTVPLT